MAGGELPGAEAAPAALSWGVAGSAAWLSSMQYSMRLLISSALGGRGGRREAWGGALAQAHLSLPAAEPDEPNPQPPALWWGRQ